MDRHIDESPSHEERRAIASLDREIPPPAELEERTVQALRNAGLLRDGPATGRIRPVRALAAAAAILVLFAAGLLAGRLTAPGPATPDYLMLLRSGPSTASGDERSLVREYAAWARAEAARGRLVSGEKLEEGGRRLGAPAGDDGAAPVEGFFLIRAASYDEAMAIARGCPHLKYGGTIELRRIEPTG